MDGTADRSGRIFFDPLTLREREYTRGQGHTQGYSLWPKVRKTQPPSHFPPSRADRTGLGACRLPAAQGVNYCHG
jgi:hypothetical protein